jgi:hypothetical protein
MIPLSFFVAVAELLSLQSKTRDVNFGLSFFVAEFTKKQNQRPKTKPKT